MIKLFCEGNEIPKSTYENVLNNYDFPDYDSVPNNTLYHNTHLENIDSIMKNGLKIENSKQLEYSGNMLWATSTPNQKGYGGVTVAFTLDGISEYEQVNTDEFCIYEDIPPNNILFMDLPVCGRDFQVYRLSDIPKLVSKYGENKVIDVCDRQPKQYVSIRDVMSYI